MVNRKKFIRLASMSFGAFMAPNFLFSHLLTPAQILNVDQASDAKKALASIALNAARSKGAFYVDVRIGNYPPANIQPGGMCVRALVNGAWGFAATNTMTNEAIVDCAEKAVAAAALQKSKTAKPQRYFYDSRYPRDLWICGFFRR